MVMTVLFVSVVSVPVIVGIGVKSALTSDFAPCVLMTDIYHLTWKLLWSYHIQLIILSSVWGPSTSDVNPSTALLVPLTAFIGLKRVSGLLNKTNRAKYNDTDDVTTTTTVPKVLIAESLRARDPVRTMPTVLRGE